MARFELATSSEPESVGPTVRPVRAGGLNFNWLLCRRGSYGPFLRQCQADVGQDVSRNGADIPRYLRFNNRLAPVYTRQMLLVRRLACCFGCQTDIFDELREVISGEFVVLVVQSSPLNFGTAAPGSADSAIV
jgi:hypothetical protein